MSVVGESRFQDNLVAIFGPHGRQERRERAEAVLRPEPDNAHDPNAVAVYIKGLQVGYLPRAQAARVGRAMASAGLASVKVRACSIGGWRTNQHDEGSYGVVLALPLRGRLPFEARPKSA